MKKKVLFLVVAAILLVSLIGACAQPAPAPSPAPAPTAQPAPKPTTAPAPSPSPTSAPAPSPSSSVKPIELSVAEFGASNELVAEVSKLWGNDIEQKSGGRLKIRYYFSQTLVKAADIYDGVRTGVAAVGTFVPSYTPGLFPLSEGIGYPFGFATAEAASKTFHDIYNNMAEFRAEYTKVKALFLWSVGAFQLFNAKRPVATLEDAKGLRVRTPGGISTDVIKAWGAIPTTITIADTYIAVQKGTVDGILTNYGAVSTTKMDEVLKYVVEGNFSSNSTGLIMNIDAYKALPADLQKVIDDVSVGYWEKGGAYFDQVEVKTRDEILKSGKIELSKLTPEQLQSWRAAGNSIVDKWAADLEAKGLPAKKFAEQAKAAVAKQ